MTLNNNFEPLFAAYSVRGSSLSERFYLIISASYNEITQIL